jgi:putative ABC transport system permease protein
MSDLKFAFRQLRKNPGFTAVVVLTLALGIGANTAIFSLINGLLLRPLPYPHPNQLLTLWERNPKRGVEQDRVSGPDYLDWRAQNTVFFDMAASPGWDGGQDFNLVLGDTTAKVHGSYTSAALFSVLGAKPWLGRTLLPDEDQPQGNKAVVLSYSLWQRYFAGNSNVIGQTLTADSYGRRDYTIVGVMPPRFGEPSACELWLPTGWMGVSLTERRSAHWHNVIARLKPGVSLAQAQTEMNAIQNRLQHSYPGETIGSEVALVPLVQQALGRNLRTALLVLWGAVSIVLLIACANVANLMLARAATRQKEIALRLALGAGRWRIVRQLLAESVLLAILGGGLGLLLGWWGLELFVAASPANVARLDNVTMDLTALGFTVGISLFAGLLFGLAPAWQFSRPELNEALKAGAHGASAGAAARQTRHALVVAEVALSVILLSGAGLMLQSFARMLYAQRGFQPEHLITAELDFSVSGFSTWVRPTATRPQVPLHALIERLRSYPGVREIGAGSRLLRRENQPPHQQFAVFGRPSLDPQLQPKAEFNGISPGWIHALGGRLLLGRDFTESDQLEAPGVTLISETLARRYFPNENPVGQRLRFGREQPPLNATNVWGLPEWSEIIGVVSDVTSLQPRPEVVPEAYFPYWQYPMQSPTLLVRTTGDPAMLAEGIRRETRALIPNLPVPVIRTMDSVVSATLAQPRLQTALLGLFAGAALLLAAIGLYGVLAYTVAQRRQEIGIRMALGAQKRDVLKLVLIQGMALALVGAGLGLAGALILTRLVRSLLYGVSSTDPITFSVVLVLLLIVALLACWVPALRAARLNPTEALRYE